MEQIYVLGKCNSATMVKVDQMANQLQNLNLPAKIFTIMKQEYEWKAYLEQICSIYGFYQKEHYEVLCFKQEGVLIGDYNDFQDYCKSQWGLTINPKSEEQMKEAVKTNEIIKSHENDQEIVSDLEKLLIKKKEIKAKKIKQFKTLINPNGKILRVKFSDKILEKRNLLEENKVEGKNENITKKIAFNEITSTKESKVENKPDNIKRKSVRLEFDANKLNQNIQAINDKNEEANSGIKDYSTRNINKIINMEYLDKINLCNSVGRII